MSEERQQGQREEAGGRGPECRKRRKLQVRSIIVTSRQGITLAQLEKLGVPIEAIHCIVTPEPVRAVRIVIVPVPHDECEVLSGPRRLVALAEKLMEECTSMTCAVLGDQPHPFPQYYSTRRCMLLLDEKSDRRTIIYAEDIPRK